MSDSYETWKVIIENSGLFDKDYYLREYPDVAAAGIDPLWHFYFYGWRENRNPSSLFDSAKYLKIYKDVADSGMMPLVHYITFGKAEGRHCVFSNLHIAKEYFKENAIDEHEFESLEARTHYNWVAQERPGDYNSITDIYDYRPDDDVPLAGVEGDKFFEKFALLSEKPNFGAAVDYINSAPNLEAKGGGVDVSIVIPIYGQLAYTLNCLDSLLKHKSKYNFEIIVGDDCSPDASREYLGKVNGIRFIEHEKNGGFIKNCNKCAEYAVGKYIVMLNNDTRVIDGWLDAMIDSFTAFPKAGMVGSKLFYSDGTLQEAGGIVWRDGSAWNYGREDDPNRPKYCYARQIDYISGCSIATTKALWDEIGGFDLHYTPAYCEDVDFAFKIRKIGLETWFQPQSKIIHYEGRTSGTDTGAGVKAYQINNTKKLYERWQEELLSHRENADEPWFEYNRKANRRVMIVDACNLTPNQDAGSLAALNLCKYYISLGYHVMFVPEDNFLYEREQVSYMQSIGIECLYAPYELKMPKIFKKYGAILDIVHFHRPMVAYKNIKFARKYMADAKIFYLNADLHYLRMERENQFNLGTYEQYQIDEMKKIEFEVFGSVDYSFTHSSYEAKIIKSNVVNAHIGIMPLIESVVSGETNAANKKHFMFLGGFQHGPNIDAVLHLIKDIWPALSSEFTDAKLYIIGSKAPEEILKRANDRIIVTGFVEDLDPYFDICRVFLAPLRYGAGVKGKVLASLAHGIPVVGTNIAAEGIVDSSKNFFAIADSVEDTVTQATKLMKLNDEAWGNVSSSAKNFISINNSFERGRVSLLSPIKYLIQ